MKATYHTDYALRLITYVLLHPEKLCTTGEVATAYRISGNHLSKVSQKLVQLKVLEAVRGRNGGVRLAPDAERWKVGDLMQALEPPREVANCVGRSGEQPCVISPACNLRGMFQEASAAFYRSLNQYHLKDLIARGADVMRGYLHSSKAASTEGNHLKEFNPL